ncbi:lipopolysaccharide heptosyltransferase II [Thermodesulfobacterium sp. TA1]|uniref:lipopolysaccharide heptosyltransferase II n=1 Tax=Thermodesulfobacterium sp. TA1 TaxID=2234087 RepID=UPI00123239C6|nr:lipopolysaccharide heptosyltransferase II [Thermodesulfobacterium sp. TA1]QER41316.1 lipopolysaccharide heptosyltransferase II [Thermodesulfobacterium sp. TA1]
MVIRIPNWLGDALMATPVYHNLCQHEKIYLLGPQSIVDLFKFFPNTEVLYYEKGNFKKNLNLLKPFNHQTGLLLTNSFSSAWLFFRAGLKERWGYAKDLRSFLLTKAVKPPKLTLHQRDYYLYLLEALKLPCNHRDLSLPLGKEAITKAKNFLKGLEEKPFIILAPGAAYGPAKMWPKEYYQKLAKNLVKKGWTVVVAGGEKEKNVGDFIQTEVKEVYNLCGKTDLITVAGMFALAEAIVSNDSGLMHLAATLKKPQVALFGSTDPEKTGPLNPKAIVLQHKMPCNPCFKRTCPYGHYKCLSSISVEEVIDALERLIKR